MSSEKIVKLLRKMSIEIIISLWTKKNIKLERICEYTVKWTQCTNYILLN